MHVWGRHVQVGSLRAMRGPCRVLSAVRKTQRLLTVHSEGGARSDDLDSRTQASAETERTFCQENEVCYSPMVKMKFTTSLWTDALLHLPVELEVEAADHGNAIEQKESIHRPHHILKCIDQPSALCSSPTSPVKSAALIKTNLTWLTKPKTTGAQYKHFSRSMSSSAHGGRGQRRGILSELRHPGWLQRRFIKAVKVEEEGVVSTEEIKRLLAEQDMKHEQGFTCFKTKCPRLAQPNKKSMPGVNSNQLFINMTTGKYSASASTETNHF